jgi:uncharacterized protein (TIGR03086 family)
MTNRIDLLDETLTEARRLIEGVRPDQLSDGTPCTEFDVRALLDHVACWVQVFDCSVNERPLDFDPAKFALDSGWAGVFAGAASGIVTGLRTGGYERPMTMTANPIPGTMVMDMLSMEYIGHGLDLAAAAGQPHRFTDEQAIEALEAARRMIQPQYRGYDPGQFHPAVEVDPEASPVVRFYGFLGRDVAWMA